MDGCAGWESDVQGTVRHTSFASFELTIHILVLTIL